MPDRIEARRNLGRDKDSRNYEGFDRESETDWRTVQDKLGKAESFSEFAAILKDEAPILLGVCRLETPFCPLRPVLDADGLYWSCTHEKPHRTKSMAPIG